MKTSSRIIVATTAAALLGAIAFATAGTPSVTVFETAPPLALGSVPVPDPRRDPATGGPDLYDIVADKAAAIRLGKALFWDMQLGSDGIVACATCHFQAGADSRSNNQLSPGLLVRNSSNRPAPDRTFTSGAGANFPLDSAFFPLRKLRDITDRGSSASRDTNDVVSSQGVFNGTFVDVAIIDGLPIESVTSLPDPDGFQAGRPLLNVRRVEPRHTPSVINAVYNHRQFWDGRAQNAFNGVNSWGDRDPDAFVFKSVGGSLTRVKVRLVNGSLASQAVSPIVNRFEMSADGRTGADLGNKLVRSKGKNSRVLRPLAYQMVHPDDSVLGSLSNSPYPGLSVTSYQTLIQAAFKSAWWQSSQLIRVDSNDVVTVVNRVDGDPDTDEYTLLEYNFPLFFGLAIQLYESTLISTETSYDKAMEKAKALGCYGKIENPAAVPPVSTTATAPCSGTLSAGAIRGLQIFLSQNRVVKGQIYANEGARCINCHAGPELTDASVSSITKNGVTRNRENQDLDRGFNNIGVRPTSEDVSIGGKDTFGNPLSITRMNPVKSGRYIAVDGAFKAPGLRNVELTPPYFHNGGHLTLDSVVEFYSRGGDFGCSKAATKQLGPDVTKLCKSIAGQRPLLGMDGGEIRPLSIPGISSSQPGLTAQEQDDLVEFLKSLTDQRVRYHQAPFDHPQIYVANGQLYDNLSTRANPLLPMQALDRFVNIPAVGAQGYRDLPDGFLAY